MGSTRQIGKHRPTYEQADKWTTEAVNGTETVERMEDWRTEIEIRVSCEWCSRCCAMCKRPSSGRQGSGTHAVQLLIQVQAGREDVGADAEEHAVALRSEDGGQGRRVARGQGRGVEGARPDAHCSGGEGVALQDVNGAAVEEGGEGGRGQDPRVAAAR